MKLELQDGELETLITTLPVRTPVNLKFGPGGVWFEFDENAAEQPPDVELILRMRGISNENTDGAGI